MIHPAAAEGLGERTVIEIGITLEENKKTIRNGRNDSQLSSVMITKTVA